MLMYNISLIDTLFNCQFLLVTGGKVGGTSFDSTEIYSDNIWRTCTALLPASIHHMSIATINNRVLLFGMTHYL